MFFGTCPNVTIGRHDLSAGPVSIYPGSAPSSTTTNSCAHRPGDEARPEKPFQGEGMMSKGLSSSHLLTALAIVVVLEDFECCVSFAGMEENGRFLWWCLNLMDALYFLDRFCS